MSHNTTIKALLNKTASTLTNSGNARTDLDTLTYALGGVVKLVDLLESNLKNFHSIELASILSTIHDRMDQTLMLLNEEFLDSSAETSDAESQAKQASHILESDNDMNLSGIN